MGSAVEFCTAAEIGRAHPNGVTTLEDGGTWDLIAGQPTDDSEMALALARALVARGHFDEATIGKADSGPFDIGLTTAGGIKALADGRQAQSDSQSNGALMRVSPIGIFAAGDPSKAAHLAAQDAWLKREGKDATRTFIQLRNRGLIDSTETAVAKAKPTQGFQTLADADLADLSYEQIIVDYPDEFSARAQWYARRTLGLPNESSKPPAGSVTPVQRRTEHLLSWLQDRSETNGGRLPSHKNAEAASVLGMDDMHQFGRVFGNIQSRIDFACYLAGLPPLGLVADEPFAMAWNLQDRTWPFPIKAMQEAARACLDGTRL